jgi:diguanylate cyclase (GGDEF)-like protein
MVRQYKTLKFPENRPIQLVLRPDDSMSQELLKIAVALTQRRDSHNLAMTLVEVVRQLVPARRITLYTLSNKQGDLEFNESNMTSCVFRDALEMADAPERLIAEEPDLVFCVRTQKRVTKDAGPEGRQRMVLPIYGSRYVSQLLVGEGVKISLDGLESLTSLLTIYTNQAALLSRNELDALTGLYNRQSFEERMKRVLQMAGSEDRRSEVRSSKDGHCFAILDIDHFKQVNDQYGHLYGDEMLLLFARIMTRTFRHEDLLFRYGGEEFAVVLSKVRTENALIALERFRRAVEAYNFPQIGKKTVSVGVTEIGQGETIGAVIDRADKALYFAKEHGRNGVYSYERLLAEGHLTPVEIAPGAIELF